MLLIDHFIELCHKNVQIVNFVFVFTTYGVCCHGAFKLGFFFEILPACLLFVDLLHFEI